MKIECGVCDKQFEIDKAVAFAYDRANYELILVCSEECIKEYTDRLAQLIRIKVMKREEK